MLEIMKLEEPQYSKKELFKSNLAYAIKGKYQDELRASGQGHITYMGAENVALFVRKVFMDKLGTVPTVVDAACSNSIEILAPNQVSRHRLVKTAIGIDCIFAGIGMILHGVGKAFGWGSGIIKTVIAFTTGVSLAAPLGWVIGGLGVMAIAGYFLTKSDAPELSEKFCNAIIESTGKAVDQIWIECGKQLA